MIGFRSVLSIFYLVCLCTHNQGNAVPFYGMDDNCILSFVVPKEKMKSSCDLDEKVTRRINSMETKINIYKQQVTDLLTQLDKQKQQNIDKLAKMEQQMRDMSVNVDMSFLIERRLGLLEKEYEQLRTDVSSSRAANGKTQFMPSDEATVPLMFNSVDNNSGSLSGEAKTMIHTEMNRFVESYTKKFEIYVQNQILTYSKVFHMVSKNNDIEMEIGRTSASSSSSSRDNVKDGGKPELQDDTVNVHSHNISAENNVTSNYTEKLTDEFQENVTIKEYNVTGLDENINVTDDFFNDNDTYFNVEEDDKDSNSTTVIRNFTSVNISSVFSIEEKFEINDSFVGDISRVNNTNEIYVVKTSDEDISKQATSRINSKSNIVSDSSETVDSEKENEKNWKEGMIEDQSHKQAEIENKIKEEIASMLLHPLAEMMNLMEKQKVNLEEKIQLQDKRCEQINTDITGQVKELDNSVQAITLQIESLSSGLEDSFSKLDKVKSLEILVNELKKNITSEPLTLSVLETEEQNKKLKKLERLMGVYQQSFEHYRNETKHEFHDLKDSLDKETLAVRSISKTLQNNLTTTLTSEIVKQNSTFTNKVIAITQRVHNLEETLILVQLDLANFEKKSTNNRASRFNDRDMDKVQDDVSQLTSKHREFRKKLDYFEHTQANLTENVTLTAKEVSSLKMEVKLSQDEWVPFNFQFDSTKTDCYGDQYIKRSQSFRSLFVGVVLCSPKRYKIFLSSSMYGKFLNIGDGDGFGEDHCEFVGGTNNTGIKLSPFKPSFGAIQGYARNHWGEKPIISYLHSIKPSPLWYECNMNIP